MKLLSKLRSNMVKAAIVGVLMAGGAFAFAPTPASAAGTCDAHGIGSRIFTNSTNNTAYSIKDGKATVTFDVKGSNCNLPVTMIAWTAPNGTDGMPYSQQKIASHVTKYFSAGRHSMTIDLPNCYFQLDTVTGTKLTGSTDGPYHYDSRQVAYMHGGTQTCFANYDIAKEIRVKVSGGEWKDNITVAPGTHVQYRVTVVGLGTIPSINLLVKDNLPAGADYVDNSLTRDGNKVDDSTFFTSGYNITKLNNGDHTTFIFEAVIGAKDTISQCIDQTIDNVASVKSVGLQTKQADAEALKKCQPKPTLVCSSLKAVATANPNEYSFTANAAATNTAITSYQFDFADGTPTTVVTDAAQAMANHTYPQLTTSKTYSAKVTINSKDVQGVTSPACMVNVTIPGTTPPPTPKTPAIKIVKTVDGKKLEQVAVGQNYQYELAITNTGEVDLTNAVVTDTPPQGVTLVSGSIGSISGNAFSYTIPALKVGQTINVTITANVPQYLSTSLINTACVNAPQVNPGNPAQPDDCDTATVVVPPTTPKNPGISIQKFVGSSDQHAMQVAVDGSYIYRVIVKNTGEVDLTNAVVTDTPPQGVTLLSADQGVVSGNAWTYAIPSLKIGESATFTLTAKVPTYTKDALVNTACVNAPEINSESPADQDACDTATVTVPPVDTPTPPAPTTPVATVLPNTGAGQIMTLFAAAAILGGAAYRIINSRRFGRE